MSVSHKYAMRKGFVFFRMVGSTTRMKFEAPVLFVDLIVTCVQVEWMRSVDVPVQLD